MADKIVFVILDGFADWEYAPLAAVLREPESGTAKREVAFASTDTKLKTSIGGLKAQPDLALEDIPDDAAGLILVGGTGWRGPAADKVLPIVRRFLDQGKLVGAICDAVRVLGVNGLLNGHRHTANFLAELKEASAYTNEAGFLLEESVHDRNLVTANGNAPFRFAADVLRALGEKEEDVVMWYEFYSIGFHKAVAKYFPEG